MVKNKRFTNGKKAMVAVVAVVGIYGVATHDDRMEEKAEVVEIEAVEESKPAPKPAPVKTEVVTEKVEVETVESNEPSFRERIGAKLDEFKSDRAAKQAAKDAEEKAEAERVAAAEAIAKEEAEMQRIRSFIIGLFDADREQLARHMLNYEPTTQWELDFETYATNIEMVADNVAQSEDTDLKAAFVPIQSSIDLFRDALVLDEPTLIEAATGQFQEGMAMVDALRD